MEIGDPIAQPTVINTDENVDGFVSINSNNDDDGKMELEIGHDEYLDTVNVHQNREYHCSEQTSIFKEKHSRHRTSLHGKALNFRNNRNDARYRRLQAKIYNFLERPKTCASIVYHVLIFASVFVCLMLSVLSTIAKYDHIAGEALLYTELIMLFWFFTEYCLRMWSAGCRSRYQSWRGRIQFAKRPFCLVDVVVILASIVVLVIGTDRQKIAASAFRGLRFFQILRMIRMDRRGGSWKLLASVVWAHRQELFTTVYIGFLGLLFSSFLIYLVEKDGNNKINNYADALWWGVITLCTVGYGDTVPTSWMGKIIAGCSCLSVISFYALPPGILGSGFALKVQQHQRQKHLIRRRVPAASLIQCLWRCYAADPSSTSIATWKIHLKPLRSPPNSDKLTRFGRFSSVKRKSEKSSFVYNQPTNSSLIRRNALGTSIPNQYSSLSQDSETPSNTNKPPDIESEDFIENSINSSRSMRKRFRALTQSMKSHMSSTGNETLTKSMNSMSILDKDGEMNDEVQYVKQLSEADKNVIRGVRKIKFFVARKKFREALRPYDVKDVMEQYSAGHVDMLARIKILQSRLDMVLGAQSNKDSQCYESKISLASRIIKMESQVESIEKKLDLFLDLYNEDRNKSLRANSSISCIHSNVEFDVESPWIPMNNANSINSNTYAGDENRPILFKNDENRKPISILRDNSEGFGKYTFHNDQAKTILHQPIYSIKQQLEILDTPPEIISPKIRKKLLFTRDPVDSAHISSIFSKPNFDENYFAMTPIISQRPVFTIEHNESIKQFVIPAPDTMTPTMQMVTLTNNIDNSTSFIGPCTDEDVWLSEIDESSECKDLIGSAHTLMISVASTDVTKCELDKGAGTSEGYHCTTQDTSPSYRMKPESQPLLVGSQVKYMKKSFC